MSEELVAEPKLTEWESEQLQKWRRSKDFAPLSPQVAVKMYELFLSGKSCEEIFRANEQKFPVGMILDARVRYEWDRRRDAYLNTLFDEVGVTVKQRTIETALFLGDVLASAHKQYGEKLQKFIQSGDPADLPPDLRVTSITTYKMIVDAFMKVTGQDQKPKGDDKPAVQVFANNATLSEAPKGNQPVKGENAFTILKSLERLDADKKK